VTAQNCNDQATLDQNGNPQAPDPNCIVNVPARGPLAIPAKPAVVTNPDMPQEIQRPSPYGDMPSLHDLYTQIPSAGGTLRRFGSDAFILGTGNANELPIDLPVGPDYVLGVGDNIAVNMWGGRSDRLSLTIDRQGQTDLPLPRLRVLFRRPSVHSFRMSMSKSRWAGCAPCACMWWATCSVQAPTTSAHCPRR
jgi:hypothetical protein